MSDSSPSPARELGTAEAVALVESLRAIPAILSIVRGTTGLRFCAVAHVTADSWTACAVLDQLDFGLRPGAQLEVRTTLCREVQAACAPIVIDHVARDPVYASHHTPAIYGFQSYASFPVFLDDGTYFGTLCGLDPQPLDLTRERVTATMEAFAALIGTELSTALRARASERDLADERALGALRDQFIAILGHDIRNPLAAITLGADLLLRKPQDERSSRLLEGIRTSARRVQRLAEDVLDLARGRLAGGIPVEMSDCDDLDDAIAALVAEFRIAHPERTIHDTLAIDGIVHCDPDRITQLLANLIANAVTHGDPAAPVTIDARVEAQRLTVAVGNHGPPIPPERIDRLFQAYQQLHPGARRGGLGLGLYIARQISLSHGGTLTVASDAERGTRFTFSMPCTGPLPVD